MKGRKLWSLVLAMGMAFSAALPAFAAGELYEDVAPGAWYAGAVRSMREAGVMNGVGQRKGSFIMIVKCTLKPNTPLTSEEIAMIEAAKKRPIQFDDDSPALTAASRAAFQRAVEQRNQRQNRQAMGQ